MSVRYYRIPWAAVSLNAAYATRFGQARRFLVPVYKDFKELVKEVLKDEDRGRQPPQYLTYRCSYLFLYEEPELFSDARTKTKALQMDEVLTSIDISNLFKMVEDALFEYLQQKDSRVTDLHGFKKCVKTLPVPVETFTDNIFGRLPAGNILIRVESSEGMLLQAGEEAYTQFSEALEGAELLALREGKKQMPVPEWYRPSKDEPSTVRIDTVEGYRRWVKAKTKRAKFAVLRRMCCERVAWVSRWRKAPSTEVVEKIFNPDILKERWRSLVGYRKLASEKFWGLVRSFNLTWAWVYYLLRDECSTRTMVRIGKLLEVSQALGKKKEVAFVGSSGGTYLYPFSDQEHLLTVYELAGSPLSRCASHRAGQDFIKVKFKDRRTYQATVGKKFDAIVCLDILDRVEDPEEILRTLGKYTDVLVLSLSFKDRRGSSARKLRPWVMVGDIRGKKPKEYLRALLTRKRNGLGFETWMGTTWRDDIVVLRRSTSGGNGKDAKEV